MVKIGMMAAIVLALNVQRSEAIDLSEMETTMHTSPPLCPADRSVVTQVQFSDICPVAPRESKAATACWRELARQNKVIQAYNRWIAKHCNRASRGQSARKDQGNLPSYQVVKKWPMKKTTAWLDKIYNTPHGQAWWDNLAASPADYKEFEARKDAYYARALEETMASNHRNWRDWDQRHGTNISGDFPENDIAKQRREQERAANEVASFVSGFAAGFGGMRTYRSGGSSRSAPAVARSSGSSNSQCNYATGACSAR